MTTNDIKNLGERKYFQDQGAYRNPYPQGSMEFNEFERGWMQSLKKDDARLAGKALQNSVADKSTPRVVRNSADEAAERYRSRK
jgi:hypothetical protein